MKLPKLLKNLLNKQDSETETATQPDVNPQWRNELTVTLKSGGKSVLWSETTDGDKGSIDDSWDGVLDWFEFKTNKPYLRVEGDKFKTMLVRDNIATIMSSVTKVK